MLKYIYSLLIFILLIYNTLYYIFFFKNTNFIFNIFYNNVDISLISLILIISTVITLFICINLSDTKYIYKNKYYFTLFNLFFFFIFFLTINQNLISFFIFYELLLIPSFLLLRYSSNNKRIILISNYFLFWTQFGSFLVLISIFILIKNENFFYFDQLTLSCKTTKIVLLFLFFGFGVKIPLWPFHFWLSKTHVEANTSFSIFLSGILVKAALFGFYKFNYIFYSNLNWFFFSIISISIIDSSIKISNQIDLKKLVAFSTIQEMGFMLIIFLFNNYFNFIYFLYFIIFHTMISGVFFYIVDCIYRRYNSRINYNISGLININPLLSTIIVLFIFIFIGIPFTIKFYIELFFLKILFNLNLIFFFNFIFFAQYISIIFFFKSFITINFGSLKNVKIISLSKKELFTFVIFFLIFCLLTFI